MPRVSIENIKDLNPTSGYLAVASYFDPSGDFDYYGYLNSEAQWYIQREDWSGDGVVIIYFCKGNSNFWTNMTGCVGLTYAPYDEVF